MVCCWNDWSWNGHIRNQVSPHHALALYYNALQSLPPPHLNRYAFVALLKACGKLRDVAGGAGIHAEIARLGSLGADFHVSSGLIRMYGDCFGSLGKAREVFDGLPRRNVVTWNTLISAYANRGDAERALRCFFEEMMQVCDDDDASPPDAVTFVCCLKACGSIRAIDEAKRLHDEITRKGFLEEDDGNDDGDAIVVGRAMVDMYAKMGSISEARQVFEKLPCRDVISWTALIGGYSELGDARSAIELCKQMRICGVNPNPVTLLCVVKACGGNLLEEEGREVHAEIAKSGLSLEAHRMLANTLVDMYARLGSFAEARSLLDTLPDRDIVTWTALIAGYLEHGQGAKALECLEELTRDRSRIIAPNAFTLACCSRACGSIGDLQRGQAMHAELERRGSLRGDSFASSSSSSSACAALVGSALIGMYFDCANVAKAREVFLRLQLRSRETPNSSSGSNLALWNALISGYNRSGRYEEAREAFRRMEGEEEEGDVVPDSSTYVCVIGACSAIGDLETGSRVHAQIELRGLVARGDMAIGNALMDMYVRNCQAAEARQIFDRELQAPDVVSWTALLRSFADEGRFGESLRCLDRMRKLGIDPDALTLACALKTCGDGGFAENGFRIHSEIEARGLLLLRDGICIIGAALVSMYAGCGLLAEARGALDALPARDRAASTALIASYADRGRETEALACFSELLITANGGSVSADTVAIVCALKACCGRRQQQSPMMKKGMEIHGDLLKTGVVRNCRLVANAVLSLYARSASAASARELRKLFDDDLRLRDLVSWNILIAGYARRDECDAALACFDSLQSAGLSPDDATYVSVLGVCGTSCAVRKGYGFHAQIAEKGLAEKHPAVANSLINMYAKCGMIRVAHRMLLLDPQIGDGDGDVTAWNTVMKGYAASGDSAAALDLYATVFVEQRKLEPDRITFVVLLNACARSCLCAESRAHFVAMREGYGIVPTADHQSCLIAALGHTGQLEAALQMIEELRIGSNAVVWHLLLGLCRSSGNLRLGKLAFEQALRLDKKDSAAYALISQIYSETSSQVQSDPPST